VGSIFSRSQEIGGRDREDIIRREARERVMYLMKIIANNYTF